jgi:hypothetical protein
MRFSTISLLALPLLAAAAEQQSPLDQAKEQAQYWFDKISSYIPNPNVHNAAEAAAAKAGGKNLNILTLNNWKETLQSSYSAKSKGPEEWWILVSGGNKTCFGLCEVVETAFNESALAFATIPSSPHLGLLNCDQQPILCNSWAAGAPTLWILDVDEPGKPVDIRFQRLNTTTTRSKSFLDLHKSKRYRDLPTYDGIFHPFDGVLAKFGADVPLGYILWAFALIPSWMFMIGVSFMSRTFM